MSPKTSSTWSYTTGGYGCTVRVFERSPGSLLAIAAYDPTLNDGRGGYRRKSLRHRDKKAAEKEARRVAALLESGGSTGANVSLGYLLDLYRHHELRKLKPRTQKWMVAYLSCWETYIGRGFPVRELSTREWDGFKEQRRSGAIDSHGHPVPVDKRRPIAPGTVNLGLDALTIACNWAVRWRVNGSAILERSPVWRLPYCKDVNPQRSVWTHDRYEKIMAAAEGMLMQVEWNGRRERLPSFLADVVFLVEATGRRLGAVRQLRPEDLQLDQGASGKIRWPSETDKSGKRWLTPITADVRRRLLKILRARPGVGSAPLFPSPRDLTQPIGEATLRKYMREAEQLAGVPRLEHDAFHGLRRKYATERKHFPDTDVAAAGGWRSIPTMKRSYQHADDVGVFEAISEPRRLRDQA